MRAIYSLLLTCLLVTRVIAQDSAPSLPAHNLVGIGAVLREDNGIPIIKQILPDGSASQAGLKSGDKIIQVDDKKVDGLTLLQVVDLISGAEGTTVKLTVQREGEAGPLSFELTRLPFHIKSATPITGAP